MEHYFTYNKKERVKHRNEIKALFSHGKVVKRFPLKGFYIISKVSVKESLRTGFGVSSKNFKKASDRNRIKRLLREAYRLQKNDLLEICRERNRQLILFIIFTDKVIPAFAEIKLTMRIILESLLHNIHEDIASHT